MDKTYLSPEEITRIVNFLGYGRLSAPVWFIGKEEGLGEMSSQDAAKNLKARATFEQTMDLYEAHLKLLEGGHPINVELNPPSTQVWRFMGKIMLARSGQEDWNDSESAKRYVRFRLGRRDGDTFLTELSPFPASNAADKRWRTLFNGDSELDRKLKQRRNELQRVLKEYAPSLVVCYGLPKKDEYAELLGVSWYLICPKIYASPDRKCLLLPFFGVGQMSREEIKKLLNFQLLGKPATTR